MTCSTAWYVGEASPLKHHSLSDAGQTRATATIRQAAPDDYQSICDLIPDEEELFLTYPKGAYPLTVEQLEKLLRRRMEPTVLLAGGRVAGFACLYGYRRQKSVFIGNLVIDRAERDRGFGKALVLHLIDLAFGKYDLPKVRISVFNRNTSAMLLYSSLGFKPYGVKDEIDYRGDRVARLDLTLRRGR